MGTLSRRKVELSRPRRGAVDPGPAAELALAAYDAWLAKWLKVKLQPKANAYDGLGLARASVFLDLRDPGFAGRFEEVFTEHVKGWGGYKVSPRAAPRRGRGSRD